MDFPWTAQATLLRMAKARDQPGEILFENSLLDFAKELRSMTSIERQGLRVSLPDRSIRPHVFEGDASSALIERIP
jgi:hypothetical protein